MSRPARTAQVAGRSRSPFFRRFEARYLPPATSATIGLHVSRTAHRTKVGPPMHDQDQPQDTDRWRQAGDGVRTGNRSGDPSARAAAGVQGQSRPAGAGSSRRRKRVSRAKGPGPAGVVLRGPNGGSRPKKRLPSRSARRRGRSRSSGGRGPTPTRGGRSGARPAAPRPTFLARRPRSPRPRPGSRNGNSRS